MLKHIRPKDIIEFFMFGLIFVSIIALAGFLETAAISLSLFVAVIIGVALWLTWFVLVTLQRTREASRPRLKIMSGGKWIDVESPAGVALLAERYPNPKYNPAEHGVRLFDQDNTKEQA